ncbi:MAG TPA: creatininase family protein [Thermoanaerobaculia bacterium]|nr:creatininase family protein [Thermoanaerobaculia bacterium]
MRLELMTWPEVEAYLGKSTGILVPIGSTEQHGPNGLLGTDAICPATVAALVGEAVGAIVAPTLAVGMSQHHMAFPGSITLRPSTLLEVVRDVVESLARHGFDHVYFLNGHGGNIATLQAAFSEIWAAGITPRAEGMLDSMPSPLRLRQRNWWSGPRVGALQKELFGDADGMHATASEVSLSWFAHPEAVRRVEMSPRVAPRGPIRDAEDFRRRFPDGRMGSDPSLASVEAGERLCAAAVDDVREDYLWFLEDAAE